MSEQVAGNLGIMGVRGPFNGLNYPLGAARGKTTVPQTVNEQCFWLAQTCPQPL
jgi:hypothetical protein